MAQGGAEALWYTAPGQAEIRPEPPGEGAVRVRALFSAVSRGTERLVFSGAVPESEFERMRAPHMGGTFPFPVKYGYAIVGQVEDGPQDLVGRVVFALHPHQTVFWTAADAVVPVPIQVPGERAVLAANMETALNAVWDAQPGPADHIAVVGGGVVGVLVARLCARIPGTHVTLVDIAPERETVAHAFGLAFAAPDAAPRNCDLVVHTSGSSAGLATALDLAGDEATVLEVSWYGTRDVTAPLGAAFHSRRLKLISSQVGKVAPSHRARWTHRRRLGAALELLGEPGLDRLVSRPVPFRELPERLPKILSPESDALCPLISYL
jgi:hypothetical protein